MASLKELVPFFVQERSSKPSQIVDIEDRKVLPKLFKALSLAVGYTGGTYSIGLNRVNFEPAPYDFDRIIQAIDTDSYLKQGFNKYKELFWKEGWTIVSDNEEAIEYLRLRIQFMELSMKKSFDVLCLDIADQLVKFGNAFVVKVRGDLAPYFPQKIVATEGKNPVIGYQILPSETVEIMRDYHNRPIKYRQNIWGANGYNAPAGFGRGERGYANLLPTWRPDEIIHFVVDQKPGRLFGTPFIVSVMDDVVALRQIEEDVQNLCHRELFPLYKYIVGTELHPAEPDEIKLAAEELAGLRTEGGLVLPERHDVEVIGSDGKALEIIPYLDHFKERVAVGLGMSKQHLGMSSSHGGGEAANERLDISLYDKIKLYQKIYASVFKLEIFDELLLEGGYDPYTPHSEKSDACNFTFNEIDVDTQVKKENHIVQKYISDLITFPEARLELKHDPEADEQQLYTAISNRLLPAPGAPIKPGGSSGGAPSSASPNKAALSTKGGNNNSPSKPDAKTPSTGGVANQPQGRKKAVSNIGKPANQFGKALSPNITHFDLDELDNMVKLINEDNLRDSE